MSLVTDLIAYLNTKSSVTTLATGGLFDLTGPNIQNAILPIIVVSSDHEVVQKQGGPTALAQARMQVVCLSNSPATARAMADALRLVTDGFSGTWNTSTVVRWCNVENVADGFTPPAVGSDISTPDVTVSLIVHFTISVPSYS